MQYKLQIVCKQCKSKTVFFVDETKLGKKEHVRCQHCQKMNLVQIQPASFFEKLNKNMIEGTVINSPKKNIDPSYLKLEVKQEQYTEYQTFDIDQERMSIGRKNSAGAEYRADVEVVTEDKFMSKKHALFLRKENDLYTISDLDSTNGTWLNGEKLESFEEVFIEDGDEIKMGRSFFLVTLVKK
jgi:predicted Zn finger-like uncharacterized protein